MVVVGEVVLDVVPVGVPSGVRWWRVWGGQLRVGVVVGVHRCRGQLALFISITVPDANDGVLSRSFFFSLRRQFWTPMILVQYVCLALGVVTDSLNTLKLR